MILPSLTEFGMDMVRVLVDNGRFCVGHLGHVFSDPKHGSPHPDQARTWPGFFYALGMDNPAFGLLGAERPDPRAGCARAPLTHPAVRNPTGATMPKAKITHQWVDGSATLVSVYVEPTFPDSVAEARAQAMHMWRDTCTEVDPEPEYIAADDEEAE